MFITLGHLNLMQDEENTDNRMLKGWIVPVRRLRFEEKKRNKYLLKSRDLVAFDGSVDDEGGTEAEDVSQKCVKLHQRKDKHQC